MIKKIIKIFLLVILLFPIQILAKPLTAKEYIENIVKEAGGSQESIEAIGDTGLAYDGTIDKNLRYIGKNPNNYINFNDELWRIIGVIKTGDEYKIKIVRNEYIPDLAWDVDISDPSSNDPITLTDEEVMYKWTYSDILKLLNPGYETHEATICSEYGIASCRSYSKEKINNSLYWESKQGLCITADNKKSSACDFRETGLKDPARKLISKSVYNTGDILNFESIDSPLNIYEEEKNVYKNKEIESKWEGYVGLPNASDFGFATSYDREFCLNKNNYKYYNSTNMDYWPDDCVESSWMFKDFESIYEFKSAYTINYCTSQSYNGGLITAAWPSGIYVEYTAGYNRPTLIYPTVFLRNDIYIVDGDGSEDNPYKVSLEAKEDDTAIEETKPSIETQSIVENPKTINNLIYLIILLILTFILSIIIKKNRIL